MGPPCGEHTRGGFSSRGPFVPEPNEHIVASVQYAAHMILKALTPEKRMEFLRCIRDGVCVHCGYDAPDNTCHCMNDE